MLVLKAAKPCVVCSVFDDFVGHCRIDPGLCDLSHAEISKRLFRCDTFERKFYKAVGRKVCSHGRSLYASSCNVS